MHQPFNAPRSTKGAAHSSASQNQAGEALSSASVRATHHLVPGGWRRIDDSHAGRIFDDMRRRSRDALRNLVDDVDALRCIDLLPLPFYKDEWMLSIEVEMRGRELGAFDMVCGPSVSYVVTGQSRWLHDKNARDLLLCSEPFCRSQPPAVLTGLYAEYLRFHNGVIWGDEGPFRVVEHAEDPLLVEPRLRRPDWTPPVKPTEIRLTPGEAWPAEASATVLYGGTLFSAEFRLHRSGSIEMVSDDSMCSGLMPPWTTRVPLRQLMPVC